MVERQPAAGRAAVDAAPAVAGEQGPAGNLSLDCAGDADVGDEPDDVWPRIRVRGRMKRFVQLLDHLGLSLEYQDVSASNGGHVQRLVAGIQDQNLLHLGRNVPEGVAV